MPSRLANIRYSIFCEVLTPFNLPGDFPVIADIQQYPHNGVQLPVKADQNSKRPQPTGCSTVQHPIETFYR